MDVEIEVPTPLNNRTYHIIKFVKSTRIFIGFIKQKTNSLPIQINPSNGQYCENKWIEYKHENELGIY